MKLTLLLLILAGLLRTSAHPFVDEESRTERALQDMGK